MASGSEVGIQSSDNASHFFAGRSASSRGENSSSKKSKAVRTVIEPLLPTANTSFNLSPLAAPFLARQGATSVGTSADPSAAATSEDKDSREPSTVNDKEKNARGRARNAKIANELRLPRWRKPGIDGQNNLHRRAFAIWCRWTGGGETWCIRESGKVGEKS